MGDNEAKPPYTETNRPSCPYPPTTDHFPMPSTIGNSGLLPESERHDNRRSIEGLIDRTEAGNIEHNSTPSAPYMNETSAIGRIRAIPTIEFENPMAYEEEMNLRNPPPSYDELFAPKNIIQPQTIPNGSFTRATTATMPRSIIVPVTSNIPGNRIIVHPPARLVGFRSTSTSSGVGVETYLKIFLFFIALLGIFIVYIRNR